PLYPAVVNKSAKTFNDGLRNGPLVTAGPFKFGPIDQTAKTVTLVRDNKWWGAPAKLHTMIFRTIDPNAQIHAIANGEIDLMDLGADVNKFNRAKALTTTDLRVVAAPNFVHVDFNGTGTILNDVTVRKAIAKSIDRGAIARSMLGPLGIESRSLGNHIYMASQRGYQDNSGDVGKYEPDKARQLLEQAGWKLDGN